jgi:two-component sensor histidine kinase
MFSLSQAKLCRPVHFICAGAVFLLLYWILESIRDIIAFEKGTFLDRFLFPDTTPFWIRIPVICGALFLMFFSLYRMKNADKNEKAREGFKTSEETRFKDYNRKTAGLESENETLKKNLLSKEWEEKELRELLREKESYLRSVHKIVRTNLQYLNGLFDARIIGANEEERRRYTEIRTLLHALIVMHTQLNKSDSFGYVVLSDFIQGVTDYLFHSHLTAEFRVHVDNPHILVPVSQAVPFVFTLCEMIYLADMKNKPGEQNNVFQILIIRTEDQALAVKIRHKDQLLLQDIEDKNITPQYQWIRELIDQQLRGDFWVVRGTQGMELNIVFKLKE